MQLFFESSNSSLIEYNVVHFRASFTVCLSPNTFATEGTQKAREKRKLQETCQNRVHSFAGL